MGNCCSNSTDIRPVPGGPENGEIQQDNTALEKSALAIQTQFRGFKARQQVNDQKQEITQHGPSENVAVPYKEWPEEDMTLQVRNTLKLFREYYFKNTEDPNTPLITLGPYRFKENDSVYMGQWHKGLRHGRGKQIWKDGSYYNGQWLNGMAHGKGRLIHADGDYYEGDWVEDRAQGQGHYYHTDGAKYEGEWYQDQQHGKGTEQWPDNAHYVGYYQFGKKHGKGRFIWNDKSTYNGDFNNNNIEGLGTYEWADGRKYVGEWLNNKMNGKGEFTWPGGKKYVGNYVEDKKEGYGEFSWPDGRVYKGQWRDGKMHGEGQMTTPDGKVVHGYWEHGRKIRGPNDSQSPFKDNLVSEYVPMEQTTVLQQSGATAQPAVPLHLLQNTQAASNVYEVAKQAPNPPSTSRPQINNNSQNFSANASDIYQQSSQQQNKCPECLKAMQYIDSHAAYNHMCTQCEKYFQVASVEGGAWRCELCSRDYCEVCVAQIEN